MTDQPCAVFSWNGLLRWQIGPLIAARWGAHGMLLPLPRTPRGRRGAPGQSAGVALILRCR